MLQFSVSLEKIDHSHKSLSCYIERLVAQSKNDDNLLFYDEFSGIVLSVESEVCDLRLIFPDFSRHHLIKM